MLVVTKRDHSTEYTEFQITGEEDVQNLPTHYQRKETNIGAIFCQFGSIAIADDDTVYTLKTTDEWE